MTQSKISESEYYAYQPQLGGLTGFVSARARKSMFETVMRLAKPDDQTKVLDVGVTSDRREDSNFFEKLYPHPNRVTAVGLEDAYFLEEEFPGVVYVRTDGESLPFPDRAFDLVVSFAVIEHVGARERQRKWLHELCRVGKACCVTTPNRFYPIEFHTVSPLIHWLPPAWFRSILKRTGRGFYGEEANLNLLTRRELKAMFPSGMEITEAHYRLLGLISNLLFFARHPDSSTETP